MVMVVPVPSLKLKVLLVLPAVHDNAKRVDPEGAFAPT